MNGSLETLRHAYHELAHQAQWPSLRTRRIAGLTHPKGYRAQCRAGELEVCAATDLGLAYALSRVCAGMRSGYLEEFLGEQQPSWNDRIVWIKGTEIPSPLRLIQLGYTTVLLDQSHQEKGSLRAQGIAVGVAVKAPSQTPTRCPLDKEYQHNVISALRSLSEIDVLLWESQLLHSSFAEGLAADSFTLSELVQAELRLVESALPQNCRLIFYVPADSAEGSERCAHIFVDLTHCAKKGTSLAFAAGTGELELNPIWDALRRRRDPSMTPLLPVMNAGAMGLGEGLWPILSSESVEHCIGCMHSQNFSGAIVLADSVPKEDGIAACNLWVAGQSLWGSQSPSALVDTWFGAFRPDMRYREHQPSLAMARTVAVDLARLSQMRTTPLKRFSGTRVNGEIDLLAAKLRILDARQSSDDCALPHRSKTTLQDYFRYFSRDAWCLLHYHLERLRLPLPGVPTAVDHSGGFWSVLNTRGRVVPGAATVTPLTEPRRDSQDPCMERIFVENRVS